jgi:hypothetical protein
MSPGSLREELEALVSYDEPHFKTTGQQVRKIAVRNHNRRRRTIGACAVLVAVIAIGSTYALTQPDNSSRPDLASDGPPRDYSAAAFPAVIESVVTDAVGGQPSTVSISAYDAVMNPVEGPKRERATAWQAQFSWSSDRVLDLFLTHARAEAEGQADAYCQARASDLVSCDVLVNEARINIIDTVVIATPASEPWQWRLVIPGEEAAAKPVWFLHEVAVRRDGQYLTVAKEAVRADTLDQARAMWQISTDGLKTIASDPRLIFPAPPTGGDGCAWVDPEAPGQGYCGTNQPASP